MAVTTATQARPTLSRRADRLFYSSMAVAIAATVFAGFARSYYLKGYFGTPELPPLRHFHGLLFTAWILLLVTQTFLVAARRTDIHRRLGVSGAVLAGAMLIVGGITAVDAAQRGASPPGIDPLAFLIVPFFDIGVFGALVLAAIRLRRRPEAHKRLMIVATLSILTAAIARIPNVVLLNPLAFFAVTDLFLLPGAIYDLRSRGRVHPAYIWGGLLLIVSQPVRVMLAGTPAWMSLAAWMVGGGTGR